MKREIERKFLLSIENANDFLSKHSPYLCFRILQGYFWEDDSNREFRVRVEYTEDAPNSIYSQLTIKEKNPKNQINSEDLELVINSKEGINLLKKCKRFLFKKRYISMIDDYTIAETNLFHENNDLIIVELRFNSEEDAIKFIPGFNFIKEVSNESKMYDFNLAKKYSEEKRNKLIEQFESFEKYRY